ncbi:MAG TPA: DUF2085 domain-containing protein [Vicinamibacterales bacterium]|nr:DUF2085 domain-containing protein [Vicinamibacterales bacterium]
MTAARLRVVLVAATMTWAGLLVVTPLLASRPHASPIASALILAVYGIGSLICHQLPERSYHIWTAQMPVCARCAGIYFGAVAGAIAGLARTGAVGARARTPGPRTILALAMTPTLVTLVYEWTTGDMPAHAIRAAAGAPIGCAVAWLVVAAAENQVN